MMNRRTFFGAMAGLVGTNVVGSETRSVCDAAKARRFLRQAGFARAFRELDRKAGEVIQERGRGAYAALIQEAMKWT